MLKDLTSTTACFFVGEGIYFSLVHFDIQLLISQSTRRQPPKKDSSINVVQQHFDNGFLNTKKASPLPW